MSERPDFTTVTETPLYRASVEQLRRLYTRYRFASQYCAGKDVLEAACGAGLGLGYLACVAAGVVGGDIDGNNLDFARSTYRGRNNIRLISLDAHKLPFEDASFDVVILYEAIYYLSEPERFVLEARRVLKTGGVLLICSANKDCPGFNPSPYSRRYFSAPELYSLMADRGFKAELFADCSANGGAVGRIIGIIKMIAVRLGLMPKTMKGKEFLKRIFHGKLSPLPAEIRDMAGYAPPVPVTHDVLDRVHKVLFAVGHRSG